MSIRNGGPCACNLRANSLATTLPPSPRPPEGGSKPSNSPPRVARPPDAPVRVIGAGPPQPVRHECLAANNRWPLDRRVLWRCRWANHQPHSPMDGVGPSSPQPSCPFVAPPPWPCLIQVVKPRGLARPGCRPPGLAPGCPNGMLWGPKRRSFGSSGLLAQSLRPSHQNPHFRRRCFVGTSTRIFEIARQSLQGNEAQYPNQRVI
jgi:hypothetical protein